MRLASTLLEREESREGMRPVCGGSGVPIARRAPSLGEFRERLQPLLEEFIACKTQSYEAYSSDDLLRSIWNYPARLVRARGKRIRPYGAYLMFRALQRGTPDTDDSKVLRLLIALEIFHLFCLVHDDIIDNGAQRHALPTVHRYVAAELASQERLHDPEHIGNAQAILLGDMLFAWSQEAFQDNCEFDCGVLQEARRYFNLMVNEVVIGEMIDVDMTTRRDTSLQAIQQKMLLKTASYTFIRPLQIGAALAGQAQELEAFCYELGLSLGIAFQMQDDLLDLVGVPQTTQKTLFSDLRERQHTYFTQYIFENGSVAQQAQLRDLMGADLQLADRPQVLDLFESSGALSAGKAIIRRHLLRAFLLIERSTLATEAKPAFYNLIDLMQGHAL